MKKSADGCEKILGEFRLILELEKKAAALYHQLAQDCDHPEVSAMLEKISQEERVHERIATQLVETAERYSQSYPNEGTARNQKSH